MRQLLYLLLLSSSTLAQPLVHIAPPVAYYCASGWRVKYHATPTCRGLENCSATIKPLRMRQVRAQRMEPCRICH